MKVKNLANQNLEEAQIAGEGVGASTVQPLHQKEEEWSHGAV